MDKSERISVVLTEEQKEDIAKWAKFEGRSYTQYLLNLHEEHKFLADKNGSRMPVGDK